MGDIIASLLRGKFISGLLIVPPSTYRWIFPGTVDLTRIDEDARLGNFPSIEGLAPAILFSLLFGALRLMLHFSVFEVRACVGECSQTFAVEYCEANDVNCCLCLALCFSHLSLSISLPTPQPLAMYAMKLSPITEPLDPEVRALYKRVMSRRSRSRKQHMGALDMEEEKREFCKQNPGRKKEDVDRSVSTFRRAEAQRRKIIKYVEALWRFVFYASFVVIGTYALFVPEPKEWIIETDKFWRGWPNHAMSDAIRLYYQVELGSYLHQLMWTEVSRSDAVEMMLHHMTTILLIGLSYITNYTRVGVTIMLLHDTADVFLESAKVFNYSSKPKGHEWAKVVCDVLFAIFALTFFVTRLILYPLFIIRSVLFEAPNHFGVDWIGFWLFALLLVILQGLHVFWFYLIARMLHRLVTTGIEKDERSDDEDEDEEEVVGGGGGAVGTGNRDRTLSSSKLSGGTSPNRKKDK